VATWRCPHCGTPQADGSRCWVCSKSPTTCSNCRHFLHGVVSGIGLCALDRTRTPIRADDVRACWQAPEAVELPRGLFAMVEALEARTQPDAAVIYEPEAGTGGLERLRRLVFAARTASPYEPVEPGPEEPSVAPTAKADQRDPNPEQSPPSFAGPPPPAGGQLHDAQTVTPALRLSYRGDARALRDAAVDAANHQSRRVGVRQAVSGPRRAPSR
jgi:hypothetical protein